MKNKLTLMFLIVVIANAFSQGKVKATKWRITELDSLTVIQAMFDDQNFVLALPFFSKLQLEHQDVLYLKYVTGICCLFQSDSSGKSLELLSEVYSKNKNAEDIEYYLARAYHCNNKFEDALAMLDKYLKKKNLTAPQKRNAELLVEYCQNKKTLIPNTDDGKLEDYKWIKIEDDGK